MDPYTIGIAIKAVQALKKSLDAAALQERVEAIDETVGAIGQHLADGVVAEVHAGFTHLEAAMTIAEPSVREDELRFARQIFNRLAQRSGNDQLLDDYTVMGAAHVAAMGHLGNYHYFLLRDQPEQALLSAYRCTEQFPALGVWLFPVELFSRDYRGPHETRDSLLAGYRHQRAIPGHPAALSPGHGLAGARRRRVHHRGPGRCDGQPAHGRSRSPGGDGPPGDHQRGNPPADPSGQAGVPGTRGRDGETALAGARRSPGAARGRPTPPLLARRLQDQSRKPLSNKGAFR